MVYRPFAVGYLWSLKLTGGGWEPDSASLRMARQLAFAVLMAIRTPKMPPTMVVHSPKPWFCCKYVASQRKKQGGSRMDSPNCVTQSMRLSVLMQNTSR